jgi:hypothetical protein
VPQEGNHHQKNEIEDDARQADITEVFLPSYQVYGMNRQHDADDADGQYQGGPNDDESHQCSEADGKEKNESGRKRPCEAPRFSRAKELFHGLVIVERLHDLAFPAVRRRIAHATAMRAKMMNANMTLSASGLKSLFTRGL